MIRYLIAALLFSCARQEAPPVVVPPPVVVGESPVAWTRVTPAKGVLGTFSATVLPSSQGRRMVTAPLPGQVTAVFVEPGDVVQAGAAIVEVRLPELAQAAAQYVASSRQVAALGARRSQLAKLRDEGMLKVSELAEAEAGLAAAEAGQTLALATLRAAGYGPAQAATLITSGGRTKLVASAAGTVIVVRAVLGGPAQPVEGALSELASDSHGRIEARLTGAFDPSLPHHFITAEGAWPVTLVQLSPVREPDGTLRAWFALAPEAKATLRPGAQGQLGIAAQAGDWQVPQTAVWRNHEGTAEVSKVRYRRGTQVAELAVTVVGSRAGTSIVRGALQAGDEVAKQPETSTAGVSTTEATP